MHAELLLGLAIRALLAWGLCALPAGAAAAGVQVGARSQEEDWSLVWEELLRLEDMDPGAKGAEALRATLAERGAVPDATSRSLLLRARLEAWAGSDPHTEREALSRVDFRDWGVAESWMVATVLLPGPRRAELVQDLLSRTPELTRGQQLIAWEVGVAEVRALRLRWGALPIQESLHERYHAGWSGYDLGQTLRRLGEVDRIREVLTEVIEQEEAAGRSSADLWSTWGIASLGFGDESRARDYLGRALAGGSPDAALVLGRLDLEAGRLAHARMNFRPSILTREPSAWALRGWGMTLLPAVRTNPKSAALSAQHE